MSRLPLLLSYRGAPILRQCHWCGGVEDEFYMGPEFHFFDDRCDRCHLDMLLPNLDTDVMLFRGCSPWSEGPFVGLENVPLLCVLNAPDHAWLKRSHDYSEVNKYETWLFFRDHSEWKAAWRIARFLVANDNNLSGDLRIDPKIVRDLKLIPAIKFKGADCVYSYAEVLPWK